MKFNEGEAKAIIQTLVSDQEFNDLSKQIGETHVKYFEENKVENFPPRFFVYGNKMMKKPWTQSVFFVMGDFGGDDIQDQCFEMGKLAYKTLTPFGVVAVFMIHEAWSRYFPDGEKRSGKRDLDTYPDKKECFVVSGMRLDGSQNSIFYPIARTGGNNIIIGHNPQFIPYSSDTKVEAVSNLVTQFYRGWAEGVKKAHEQEV